MYKLREKPSLSCMISHIPPHKKNVILCYTKSVTLKTTKLGRGNSNYTDCFQFRSILQNMTSS